MKSKVSYLIATIFIAYVTFVIFVIFVYETRPEDRSWQERQEFNHKMLSEIIIGQTIDSIRQLMGRADFSEAKASSDGSFQIMFYRTHHVTSDGQTTKDECTPLLFKDGELIAWGQETYEQFLQIPIIVIAPQTETDLNAIQTSPIPAEQGIETAITSEQ
ncbi:DUF3192 domain-containing protein [Shewanella sp. 10N.286.51.B8]|uniref:DUF3192 domain-containing protein n=1 Tax=Shewanella sp. 10N.286.51.B8 TaxID=3229708 RepID=UPI00354E29BB